MLNAGRHKPIEDIYLYVFLCYGGPDQGHNELRKGDILDNFCRTVYRSIEYFSKEDIQYDHSHKGQNDYNTNLAYPCEYGIKIPFYTLEYAHISPFLICPLLFQRPIYDYLPKPLSG